MAKQIERVIVMKHGKVFAMCKATEASQYTDIYKNGEVQFVKGTYKRGRPDGMQIGVAGIFIDDEGKEYIVYVDQSANRKEDTDEKGYPTEEFLKRKEA